MSDDLYTEGTGNSQDAGIPPDVSSGEKPKKSNFILNLLMILFGLLFLGRGVLTFLTWLNVIPIPEWLQNIYAKLSGEQAQQALSFLGPEAIISSALGFWAFIAGILMFFNEESGWGMAVVVLSTMALMGGSAILNWITIPNSFDVGYWPNWITMLTVVVGVIGFFWLLFTKKRYK
ncbi:MAG: hypothetical protein JW969_20475 [Spirochaetales bacterium]|nr:hypothetical protein [Spirochaetales bacterium]